MSDVGTKLAYRALRAQISNWHIAKVTNAAAEAANNLVNLVKRAAFGH